MPVSNSPVPALPQCRRSLERSNLSRLVARGSLRTRGSSMRKSLYLVVAAATLCLAGNTLQALPITAGAVKGALDATNMVEQTAVYVVEGRRFCFYFDGWHGAGWYRCGFANRRGLGWGGVYGWRGWEYGPAARRFGRSDVTIREGRRYRDGMTITREGSRRDGINVREGNRRDGMTIREGNRGDGANFRDGASRDGAITRGRNQQGAGG